MELLTLTLSRGLRVDVVLQINPNASCMLGHIPSLKFNFEVSFICWARQIICNPSISEMKAVRSYVHLKQVWACTKIALWMKAITLHAW